MARIHPVVVLGAIAGAIAVVASFMRGEAAPPQAKSEPMSSGDLALQLVPQGGGKVDRVSIAGRDAVRVVAVAQENSGGALEIRGAPPHRVSFSASVLVPLSNQRETSTVQPNFRSPDFFLAKEGAWRTIGYSFDLPADSSLSMFVLPDFSTNSVALAGETLYIRDLVMI